MNVEDEFRDVIGVTTFFNSVLSHYIKKIKKKCNV